MPAAKKHQVHPEHPNDLICDTCPNRSPWQDSMETTVDRARFRGWRIFDGESMTGKPVKVACCPSCFKTGAPQRPNQNLVMEGQMDLPGLFTPVQVPKSKRNNRNMS